MASPLVAVDLVLAGIHQQAVDVVGAERGLQDVDAEVGVGVADGVGDGRVAADRPATR